MKILFWLIYVYVIGYLITSIVMLIRSRAYMNGDAKAEFDPSSFAKCMLLWPFLCFGAMLNFPDDIGKDNAGFSKTLTLPIIAVIVSTFSLVFALVASKRQEVILEAGTCYICADVCDNPNAHAVPDWMKEMHYHVDGTNLCDCAEWPTELDSLAIEILELRP